jgi:hypothetical protein
MTTRQSRGYRFFKQLPTRFQMGCPNALNSLDEAIAALRVVDPTCTPPGYMIGDLQRVGSVLGFRPNSRGYLRHMAGKANTTPGDVLECGSGLSTLLLAITAGRLGHHVHTFEHDSDCRDKLHRLIERYHLRNVTVHHTPIRSYGSFDWYELPDSDLSRNFSLVICDGPAKHLTDSGRYGLFPVMRGLLDPHCRVILDDSNGSIDRRVIHRWRKEHQIEVHSFGRFLQFAEIVCV